MLYSYQNRSIANYFTLNLYIHNITLHDKFFYFSGSKSCLLQLDILIYAQHNNYLDNQDSNSIWLMKLLFIQGDWFLITALCKTINSINRIKSVGIETECIEHGRLRGPRKIPIIHN